MTYRFCDLTVIHSVRKSKAQVILSTSKTDMVRRIVSIQFSHETNTFNSTVTDMAAFKRRIFVEGDEVPRRFRAPERRLGAHIVRLPTMGGNCVNLLPLTALRPVWSRDMLDYCAERLTQAAKGADGAVLMALHGAMVVQGIDDAEGYLLEKLRGVMGPSAPIIITLDTHANVTDRMGRHVNALYAYPDVSSRRSV